MEVVNIDVAAGLACGIVEDGKLRPHEEAAVDEHQAEAFGASRRQGGGIKA